MSENVVEVVTEALEKLAKKWTWAGDEMTDAAYRANLLDLSVSSFWIGHGTEIDATIRSSSYNEFQRYTAKLLNEASTEFKQLGVALTKIAAHYDQTDQVNSVNLDGVFGEPDTNVPE